MYRKDNRGDSLSSLSNFLSFTDAHFPAENEIPNQISSLSLRAKYFFNRLRAEKKYYLSKPKGREYQRDSRADKKIFLDMNESVTSNKCKCLIREVEKYEK